MISLGKGKHTRVHFGWWEDSNINEPSRLKVELLLLKRKVFFFLRKRKVEGFIWIYEDLLLLSIGSFTWRFFLGSRALFAGPASTEKRKFCFQIGSHGTIYTFKYYFVTVFLVISFQFLAISRIQTDPKNLQI